MSVLIIETLRLKSIKAYKDIPNTYIYIIQYKSRKENMHIRHTHFKQKYYSKYVGYICVGLARLLFWFLSVFCFKNISPGQIYHITCFHAYIRLG